ncbi:hypothetical protein [Azospirillum isscasi]|uniref:Uncharacterized protein n=1 Tax=Azospirillum isscasi TaxID=3053926 RepID=A0ABU0WD22_9PROT|nr:hypothetical protein [Azospirillum isscasi]MDQ2101978.1 hypothetical protein [Azospirillum isscasi]
MNDDSTGDKGPVRKTDIGPLCDEQSGGGGSNPDTRYRGMPGGHPGGSRDGDCDPVSRADPDSAEPDSAAPDSP